MLELYTKSLSIFHHAFARLEKIVEPPALTKLGSDQVYRYQKQSIEAAIMQELAHVISGLHA